MTRRLEKLQQLGFYNLIRLLITRAPRYLLFPLWYIFKYKNKDHKFIDPSLLTHDEVKQALEKKEASLRTILLENHGKNFLEIGIGEFPNIDRIKLIQKNNIKYTACDFQSVCENHKKELTLRGISTNNTHFVSNTSGTYTWNLFQMVQRGEMYDVIYLDGHHTFYVDLPVFLLGNLLLKPGGYFLVDDIQWTLNFIKHIMLQRFDAWYFYRKIYNFREYDLQQQTIPHMQMLAEQILIAQLGFSKTGNFSTPQWWALKKPLS